ncbi:MAG: DHHA1 domain-containing protein, partial [Deltaproteobacteria bacterium]|nr:DHHA1 domain-containing protein [Deltaproteobacteria bacterium]
VVMMGESSKELCGGTHVQRTGDIGFLKITHESSVAAGVRRVEAVTGRAAVQYVGRLTEELKAAANLLKAGAFEVAERVEKTLQRQHDLEKEIATLKGKLAAQDSADLLDRATDIKGIRVLAAVVEAADPKTLRELGDRLRDQLRSGIILLGSQSDGKAMLLCLVTSDLTGRYQAGRIIKELAPLVGGSGGGRPDLAQAGGPKPENLAQAVARLRDIL